MRFYEVLFLCFIIVLSGSIKPEYLYLKNDAKKPLILKVNGRILKPDLTPLSKQELNARYVKDIFVAYRSSDPMFKELPLENALRKAKIEDYVAHIIPEQNNSIKVGKIEPYKSSNES